MIRISIYLLCLFSILSNQTVSAQNSRIDSLRRLLRSDKADTNKVKHCNILSWEYMRAGEYDTSRFYANAALKLAKELNYNEGAADAHTYLAGICKRQNDFPKAIEEYKKALAFNLKTKNRLTVSGTYTDIGIVYSIMGDYPTALDYQLKALKIDEKLNAKKQIARDNGNIGIIYFRQADFKKSLEFHTKALHINTELKDKKGMAMRLGNIGNVQHELGDYHKALRSHLQALSIDEELDIKIAIENDLGNIGIDYRALKDYPKALEYNMRSLKIAEELGDKTGIAVNLDCIGSIYYDQKKYKEALDYEHRSLKIHREIGAKDGEKAIERRLYETYKALGDTKNALLHHENYIILRDTLFSEENKKLLIQKEMNFEFERKEAATKAEQDKKDAIAREELKQKEHQRNYFIGGSGLLALLIIFIFRGYRHKQKANLLLEQKNNVIESQKEILEEKNKNIVDSIRYAKRIQQSLLPTDKYIERNLKRLKK